MLMTFDRTLFAHLDAATTAPAMVQVPVIAQASRPLPPPKPGEISSPPSILTMIVLALIIGVVMFAAVFPSKRGHQD